ncbi:MAG: polymer-forming cytoskeletal protein [Deltaproteobacteria bacterium]|nr:polymer-forming cytoskeletal protein [Deltaproteobacteria bacterium]
MAKPGATFEEGRLIGAGVWNMFGRKRDGTSGTTLVGQGAVIEGSLESEQDIHVDGRVGGSVESAGTVSIGAAGAVLGRVRGDTVTIGGRVEGTVTATSCLHMLSTGCIQGDAFYGSLEVDRGGVIEGQTTPLTSAQAVPEAPAPSDPPRLLPEVTSTLLYPPPPPPPSNGAGLARPPSVPPPPPPEPS